MDRSLIFAAIVAERRYQDEKWGGPEHDKGHSLWDWIVFLTKFLGKLAAARMAQNWDECRIMLLKIAALCVAALEHAPDQQPPYVTDWDTPPENGPAEAVPFTSDKVEELRQAAFAAGSTYGSGPNGGVVMCLDETNRQLARIADVLEDRLANERWANVLRSSARNTILSILANEFNCNEDRRALLSSLLEEHMACAAPSSEQRDA